MGLLSGIAGAAGAGIEMLDDRQKEAVQARRDDHQSELARRRDAAMEQLKAEYAKDAEQRALTAKNQPLNDYADAVGKNLNSEVPASVPPPVTKLNGLISAGDITGVDGQPLNGGTQGFSGDIAKLKAQIINAPDMSDKDKQGALAQIDAQARQANDVNAAMTPRTRAMTQTEASDKAMQDLLRSGNGPAYAAGKPLVQDKTLSVADGAAIIDPRTGKVLFQNSGKADRQIEHEDAQTKLQQDRFDQQEKLKRMEQDPLGLNAAAPGGAPGTVSQAIAAGATGDDLLATLPKAQAEVVKALANGRMPFPSGFALKSPHWQSMLTLVGQYDPSFDAVNYGKRSQTANAFAKGKQGDAVRAVNQTLSHMGNLSDSIDKLDNFNGAGTLLNAPVNFIEEKTGDTRQGNFKQTVQAVAGELRKVFSNGGVGNLQELKQWEESFPVNASKEQQKSYLKNATDLLQGAMGALDNQYREGMGPKASINDLVTPKARAVLDKLTGGPTPSGTSLTYDPATGSFH